MQCKDCAYCWKEDGDKIAVCHYEGIQEYAPCELDDVYEEEADYPELWDEVGEYDWED